MLMRTTEASDQPNKFLQHVIVANSGFAINGYDYIAITYPIATQEVYTYKSGGSGGTTVGTITVDYVDATKAELSSVTRS